MSTGRKSQVEKFNARMGKVAADTEVIKQAEARQAYQPNNIMKEGEKIMKETTGRSDVFAVIARDSMETFIQTWNNSMTNVIRETIRTEVQAMVQAEMEAAMKGMFAGMSEAVVNMMGQAPVQSTTVTSDEPVEFDMTNVIPMEETIKRAQLKQQATTGPLSQRVVAEQELMIMATKEGAAMGTKKQLGLEGVDTDGDSEVKTLRKGRVTTPRNIVDWKDKQKVKQYLFDLLTEAETKGIDIQVGKQFKTLGGVFNTAYQKGVPALYGGGKGGWEQLITEYIAR